MFGFVKDLLGFNIGGVVADGKLNPTNVGAAPSGPTYRGEVYSRPRGTLFRQFPSQFRIGGIVRKRSNRLKKKRRGCGCRK